jgi:group I intron endonuclease
MSARILSGIYRIRNVVNGKVYVGSAVNVTKRWRIHKRHLNKGTHHCRHLQSAWLKYRAESFVFEIIEAVEPTREALLSREQVCLTEALASGLCYNLAPTAGSALGVKRSEAWIAKARSRRQSAETVAKISASLMGHEVSPETRIKLGGKRSAEACANIKAGHSDTHGERHPGARLSNAEALAIWNATGSQRTIALRFGVSQFCVARIRRGEGWAHITGGPSSSHKAGWSKRLNKAQASAIKEAPGTLLTVARRFGVSQTTVSMIRRGKTWKR